MNKSNATTKYSKGCRFLKNHLFSNTPRQTITCYVDTSLFFIQRRNDSGCFVVSPLNLLVVAK